MPSSISHFKGAWPKQASLLGLTLLLTLGASVFYTLRLNPELVHFKKTHALKQAWAQQMTHQHGAKVVVYGGSSCEFSIDGQRFLDQFQLPCVNLGRGAGMGPVVLTMAALEETRSGDTLILAMEPALFTGGLETPSLGAQFSLAVGHPDWLRHPLPPAPPASWADILLALRPGGFHTFTMLAKCLRGQPLYRYRIEEMHPSGWNQTPVRLPVEGPPGHSGYIPEESMQFLRSLRQWCAQHKVQVAYSLPWAYTPPDKVPAFQALNLQFLIQMSQVLPVLRDPRLGADTVRDHFSDTAWHLVEEAAALRTDELGRQITAWEVWSTGDLERHLQVLHQQ